jgi:SAM-dependent methyltransferase
MRSRAPVRIPDDEVPQAGPTPSPPPVDDPPIVPIAPMRMITVQAQSDLPPIPPPDPPTIPLSRSSLPPAPGTVGAPDPGWTPAISPVHIPPTSPAPFTAPDIEEIADDDVAPDSDGDVPAPPPPRPPSVSRPDLGAPPARVSGRAPPSAQGGVVVPAAPPPRPPSLSRPPPAEVRGPSVSSPHLSDAPPRAPMPSRPPPAEVPPPRALASSDIDVVEEATERVSVSDIEELAPAPTPPPPAAAPPPVATAPPASSPAPTSKDPNKKRVRPWWEEMFDDDMLRTVERLSDKQVISESIFIEDRLGLQKGAIILDLACGEGRHAVELTRRGYKVVGYDLSLAMLARAADEAEESSQKINFLHGDMREMAFESMFDGVYCWGMSFGFFEEDKNFQVIQRAHRALRPGGVLLLDVVNRDFVAARQPSMVWFEGEGCVCMDEMQIDFITSRLKVKRTVMLDDGRSREIDYSIRLYGLHELGKMLHDAGFKVLEVSGQIATPGVFFGSESPRSIILAERS